MTVITRSISRTIQTIESTITQGQQGKYYIINGYKYDIHFPIEWAINDTLYETGPQCCKNCHYFGSINLVFVGYCSNCGLHIHKQNRPFLHFDALSISIDELWQQLPYLHGIYFDEIGDDYYQQDQDDYQDDYQQDQDDYQQDQDNYQQDQDDYQDERDEEEEEYQQYLKEQDFIQDAEDYHDQIMEKRIRNKKTMTPQQFRVWEITSSFGKSIDEIKYETYLKTGNLLC